MFHRVGFGTGESAGSGPRSGTENVFPNLVGQVGGSDIQGACFATIPVPCRYCKIKVIK